MTAVFFKIETILAKALSDFNAGRFDEAAATCQHLLQQDPSNPAVRQMLALVSMQAGNIEAAREHIRDSLARRPDHVPSLLIAGRIERAANDLPSAAGYFEHASVLAVGKAEPVFLFGTTLLDLNHPAAEATLRYLVDQHPQHSDGWCSLGLALIKKGELAQALDAFERAVAIDPRMAKAHFHRANTLQKLGRLDEAIAAFQLARQCNPKSMEICFNLGLTLRKAGLLEAAREALESTTILAPTFAEGWFNLGLVRQDQHGLDDAISAFRTALTCQPDYAEAAVNLGIVLQESGSMDKAIEAYRVAMRLRPETFGRIAQAITGARTGRLCLDLEALRHTLSA